MRRFSMRANWSSTSTLLLLVFPAVVLLSFASWAIFSAQRSLSHAAESVQAQDHLPYVLRPLQPASAAARFEPVAPRSSYTSGIFLSGRFYLGGPAGLTIAGPDGLVIRTLRTGIELPVAPIVAVAVGRLRGMSEPEVILATSGAGVLLLQPAGQGAPALSQLLPDDPALQDLSAVLPLAAGDLLLGTRRHGVLLYSGASLSQFPFSLEGVNASRLEITALAASDAASFLVGTRNNGVFYAHAGTVEHASVAGGLPDDEVEALLVVDRRAYVGTPVGTGEFDLAAGTLRPLRILGAGLFSHSLAVRDRQLFIGTIDQGVKQIPLDQSPGLRRASISVSSAREETTAEIEGFLDAPDGLYALAGGALSRRAGGSWIQTDLRSDVHLADRNISALAFAPDGSLYVGFFDHGLDLLSPDATEIRHYEDDHLFCINRLALDPQRQTMAAATANGLVLFDEHGAPRQTLTRRDGLISDHVTDIAFLDEGAALATPGGITFLTGSGAESLYAFQGLVNNHVYALAAGPQDKLLAGTLGGLSILKAKTVERNLTVTNSELKHNWITALLPIGGGNHLVGTYGAGLESLDAQSNFFPVDLPTGTPRNLVINPNALLTTRTHLYAGTLDHGLLAYNKLSGRWFSVKEGLPSRNVTALAAREGVLYIGTENGLVRSLEGNLP